VNKHMLFGAVLVACASTGVMAQPPGGGPGRPPAFEDLDANGDGFIAEAEFSEFIASRPGPGRPGGQGRPGGPDGQGGQRGQGGPGGGPQGQGGQRGQGGPGGPGGPRGPGGGFDPQVMFGRMDANGDGEVSRKEFEANPGFARGGRGGPGGAGGPDGRGAPPPR
jgi:hypothetical protein